MPLQTTRCGSHLNSRSTPAARTSSDSIRRIFQELERRSRRLPIVATVTVPAKHVAPSTTVARVYPSGDTVPENLLRMYVEFSGPMGRPSGIPHMKLLGADGREIEGAFLPLDYEFWDPAHTRFTAFLDPGRVKSGILPNKQMGRALDAGRTVTLVISREWRDEHGLPLKDDYRRVFHVARAGGEAARSAVVAHRAAGRGQPGCARRDIFRDRSITGC